jgi:hypothetical protein
LLLAEISEPTNGVLFPFTTGILLLFEAVLIESVVDTNIGSVALAVVGVCLISNTNTSSLGSLYHTLGQIPRTVDSVESLTLIVLIFGITWSKI